MIFLFRLTLSWSNQLIFISFNTFVNLWPVTRYCDQTGWRCRVHFTLPAERLHITVLYISHVIFNFGTVSAADTSALTTCPSTVQSIILHMHLIVSQVPWHWQRITFSIESGAGRQSIFMGTNFSRWFSYPQSLGFRSVSSPIHTSTW